MKFEQGLCEQTYKFEELEFDGGETFIRAQITDSFIAHVLTSFISMQKSRLEFLEPA